MLVLGLQMGKYMGNVMAEVSACVWGHQYWGCEEAARMHPPDRQTPGCSNRIVCETPSLSGLYVIQTWQQKG